ncbi:hypothetical protein LWI29_019759 [Acer saccharum]|uniref:Uncharacterized protein n=1 Tax=Acer saccharum TaxID=4024 RepID=A0AA39VP09_ACESA|nr:hypothetical protein LWI29_019759 [Acer saccharum]
MREFKCSSKIFISVEGRRLIEASQRKIEDLNAKLVVQDEKIKELEGKSTPTRQYVRSAHRSSFLGGISG